MTEQEVFDKIEQTICQRGRVTKEELGLTRTVRLADVVGGDNAYELVHLCSVWFARTISVDVQTVTAGELARICAD
jgi:hypothetical protein